MNPPFDDAPPQDSIEITAEERPCFRCFYDWTTVNEKPCAPGVWHFGTKETKDSILLTQTLICSPLEILAISCDRTEHNFGRLIRIKNSLGKTREWAMPMELLSGSADALHKELLAMGVTISPTAGLQLKQYFNITKPERKVTCATQTGWHDDCFVLPDVVIGPNSSDVVYQAADHTNDYSLAGSLSAWRKGIAKASEKNQLMVLAISAAFAGPLLNLCGAEGGGLHFVGDSSTGKTTLLEVACSVWGGPRYKRSWRTTANGMEGAAALFNDSLLAIDEIGECDPRDVGAIVYALANGVGKQRANRFGLARAPTRWRCMVLSSGERSISTSMAEGGYRIKAGQSIRIVDIPCARQYGAFDDLYNKASGAALADSYKRQAGIHHGHPGRAFLREITAAQRDWKAELEEYKKMPELQAASSAEGQERRVAAKFALIAFAGEVATEYGITGWPTGLCVIAAELGLQLWRQSRANTTTDNTEKADAVSQLCEFIDEHGDSRFSNLKAESTAPVRDRAGWWEDDIMTGVRVYWFTGVGLRHALNGFDFHRACESLINSGVLTPGQDRHATTKTILGRSSRVYRISINRLLNSPT